MFICYEAFLYHRYLNCQHKGRKIQHIIYHLFLAVLFILNVFSSNRNIDKRCLQAEGLLVKPVQQRLVILYLKTYNDLLLASK